MLCIFKFFNLTLKKTEVYKKIILHLKSEKKQNSIDLALC